MSGHSARQDLVLQGLWLLLTSVHALFALSGIQGEHGLLLKGSYQ